MLQKNLETFTQVELSLKLYINAKSSPAKRSWGQLKKSINKHNMSERAKELSDMQLSISHAHINLNTGVSDMTEGCCLPKNTLEQLTTMNLCMSMLVPDIESICVSEF